jgi:radical SAM superfamily enzyme YgiQ (UPF0313 family)
MKKPPAVLLINPWIYDFAAYDFWARPLGLLYIASVLRENGCTVRLVDCLASGAAKKEDSNHRAYGDGHFHKAPVVKPDVLASIPRKYSRYGMSPDFFAAELQKLPPPDVIMVGSMMTYWYPGVFHAIRLVKDHFPGVPVMLGGLYATLCHEHAARYSGADVCIRGAGEAAVLKMVSELTGRAISVLPDHDDPDSLPYPAFDLLREQDVLCIVTARGCPYKCTYCASSLLSNGFRARDPSKVLDEISYWVDRYKCKNIAFYDDALLYRADDRIIPLLRGILKRGISCNFHAPNGLHARAITQEVAEVMYRAGFKTIRIGLETADDGLQMQTGGKVTNREFEQAVRHLREAGYPGNDIGVYLLAGLPGQKIDEVRKSIRYVRDCGARPYLAEYSPIPGTALWEDARRHSSFNLDEPLCHNNSILPCRIEGLSWKDLYQLKSEVKDDKEEKG